MTAQIDPEYLQQGYSVAHTALEDRLRALRRKFLAIFDMAATANGLASISDDSGVRALYESERRDLWVGVYDQLPFLPEVMGLANSQEILAIAQRYGIRQPALAGMGTAVLANMPFDEPFMYVPHQDITYNSGSLNSITVWVPLQDVLDDIGPLEVVPQSHRRGIIEAPQWLSQRHSTKAELDKSKFVTLYKDEDYVSLPIQLGQCLVFSQFLVHRSGENVSDRIRFTLQYRFRDLACIEYARRNFSLQRFTEDSGAGFSENA